MSKCKLMFYDSFAIKHMDLSLLVGYRTEDKNVMMKCNELVKWAL